MAEDQKPADGLYPVIVVHLTDDERETLIRLLATAPTLGCKVITFRHPAQGQLQIHLAGREAPVNPAIIEQIEAQENGEPD